MLIAIVLAACAGAPPTAPADAGEPPAPAAPAPVPAPEPPLPPPAPPVPPPPAPVGPLPDGAPCLDGAECASGICEGEGCDANTPGTCMGQRPCTRDLRPFCGCDGETFRTSGSCPNRRFAHRGACPGDPPFPVP